MEHERVNDIRVLCRLNILRLYPAHRQAALTDRTDFNAWKAENVAHMQKLIDSGTEDIDDGWPDPAAHERVEPSEAPLDRTLTNLEKAQEALKPAVDAEPPAAIAELFDPSLTARQNQEKLQARYKDAMSEHYRLMGYGTQEDKAEAQRQLEKAQRIESGINWNRARLAEVV